MLVLAIDTATTRVSARSATAARCSARCQLAGGRRHAEQLAPAIQYLCGELDVSLDAPRGDRGRHRARPVHRAARRGDHRQGHGAGACASRSSRAEPRPRGVSACATPNRLDRRGARRPPPRGVRRVATDRCPAACNGCPTTRCGTRPSWSPSSSPAPTSCCSPATASPRYRDEFAALDHAELAGVGHDGAERRRARRARRPPAPSARSSQPQSEIRPLYLRTSDAEINWDRAPTWVGRSDGRLPEAVEPSVHIQPMRRRHVRSVLQDRAAGVPAPVERVAVPLGAGAAVDPRVLRRADRSRARRATRA